jgi:hypothetical protein
LSSLSGMTVVRFFSLLRFSRKPGVNYALFTALIPPWLTV